MIDWQNPNGLQLELALEALLSAFPSPADMAMLLTLKLNQDYAQLTAGSANYRYAVFQVITEARAGGWLEDLIRAAITRKPKSPKLRSLPPLTELADSKSPAGVSVEDLVRQEGTYADLAPWIRKLDQLRAQVCRIEYPVNQAIGTGWLVADDLVLTNWHVVRHALTGGLSHREFACRFDYAKNEAETSAGQTVSLSDAWCVDSKPASDWELGTGHSPPKPDELDFALLKLSRAAGSDPLPSGAKRGFVRVRRSTPVPGKGTILFILQHPQGHPIKLAIGTAGDLNENGTRVRHDANTEKGSSGSPVFDANLEPLALHNTGDPYYADGTVDAPKENQAVPLARIVASLESAGAPAFWSE